MKKYIKSYSEFINESATYTDSLQMEKFLPNNLVDLIKMAVSETDKVHYGKDKHGNTTTGITWNLRVYDPNFRFLVDINDTSRLNIVGSTVVSLLGKNAPKYIGTMYEYKDPLSDKPYISNNPYKTIDGRFELLEKLEKLFTQKNYDIFRILYTLEELHQTYFGTPGNMKPISDNWKEMEVLLKKYKFENDFDPKEWKNVKVKFEEFVNSLIEESMNVIFDSEIKLKGSSYYQSKSLLPQYNVYPDSKPFNELPDLRKVEKIPTDDPDLNFNSLKYR